MRAIYAGTAWTNDPSSRIEPACVCEGCRRRDGRIEQLLTELRRLDERLGYQHAQERDERRRKEPLV